MQKQILNPETLTEAGKVRFPKSQEAQQVWECIWSSLLPVVLENDKHREISISEQQQKVSSSGETCRPLIGDAYENTKGTSYHLSRTLVDRIVSQVINSNIKGDVGLSSSTT